MKIHLVPLRQECHDAMLRIAASAEPKVHTLVDDPGTADMILFVGGWHERGRGVVDSPLPRKYPEKTFIYSDDDGFVPLLPGLYAAAEKPRFINWKRYKGAAYINRFNPFVTLMDAEKRYLFSFAGGSTSLLRKKLYRMKFRRPDVLIENTSNYYHWDPTQPGREERQKKYAETIAASRFGLCPRGASAGSIRLFELMEMGVAPVIVSDGYLPPEGPDWESFALMLPERKLGDLERLIVAHEGESAARGRLARAAFEQWFASEVAFNHLIAAVVRVRDEKKISERWVQPFWGYMLWRQQLQRQVRGWAKSLVLLGFRMIGKKVPFAMNTR
jgi:hypothetical protein